MQGNLTDRVQATLSQTQARMHLLPNEKVNESAIQLKWNISAVGMYSRVWTEMVTPVKGVAQRALIATNTEYPPVEIAAAATSTTMWASHV